MKHSDFIVYVDESGDHSLRAIDPQYPLFVLSLCVFRKEEYTQHITPAIRRLKFETFGHDMVVLHESDIRFKRGPFAQLSKEPRESFLASLTETIAQASFRLVAIVIDKRKLRMTPGADLHPYHLALTFGLERLHHLLRACGSADATTFVVCESRGRKEDAEMEQAFRSIINGANCFQRRLPFECLIAAKQTNSEGLQIADLTARPIGLSVLRPGQSNRAAALLEHKLRCEVWGQKWDLGLMVYPSDEPQAQIAEGPPSFLGSPAPAA